MFRSIEDDHVEGLGTFDFGRVSDDWMLMRCAPLRAALVCISAICQPLK